MVLRKGRIYAIPVSPDNIVDQQVLFGESNVGKVVKYDQHKGATVYTGLPPFHEVSGISLSSLRQIVIATQDRVNDLQPGPNGITIRPLKLDQWNFAIANYDLNGDQVQFGWWKESERDTFVYFQLALSPYTREYSQEEENWLELIRLARRSKASDEQVLLDYLKQMQA